MSFRQQNCRLAPKSTWKNSASSSFGFAAKKGASFVSGSTTWSIIMLCKLPVREGVLKSLRSSMTYFNDWKIRLKIKIYYIFEDYSQLFYVQYKRKDKWTGVSFSTQSNSKSFPYFISNQPYALWFQMNIYWYQTRIQTSVYTYVFTLKCIHLCVKVNVANCNCILAREIHITAGRNLKKYWFSLAIRCFHPHTRASSAKQQTSKVY